MCIACLKYKQGELILPDYLRNLKEFQEFEHDPEAEEKARAEFETYLPSMKSFSFDPTFKEDLPQVEEVEDYDDWWEEEYASENEDWITEIEDNNPED